MTFLCFSIFPPQHFSSKTITGGDNQDMVIGGVYLSTPGKKKKVQFTNEMASLSFMLFQ